MNRWDRLRLRALRLFRRAAWRELPMQTVVERFGTPERINDYMQVCFDYVSDEEQFGEEELWQPPARTFLNKRGDCEDYALFAWHVLRVNGFAVHLFAAFTEDRGHAVCVFEERWHLHTICNEGLKRANVVRGGPRGHPNERTARKLADAIYPRLWTACGFVRRMEVGSNAEGEVERLLPEYDWVVPAGGA